MDMDRQQFLQMNKLIIESIVILEDYTTPDDDEKKLIFSKAISNIKNIIDLFKKHVSFTKIEEKEDTKFDTEGENKTGRAYDRGREDGKRGISKNPYIPGEDSREDYRKGNNRGVEIKSNSEAND